MAKKRISENVVSQGAASVPAYRKTPIASHKKHTPANSVGEPAARTAALHIPSHEDIAALAYSYWVARGCPSGSAEEDWLRAEGELCQATQAVGA
jgi:hypothetical protein